KPLLGRGDLEQPHRPVVAARGERLAIGGEGHRGDDVLVALEDADFLPGAGLPETDRAIGAGRGDGLAVGTEGQGADPAGVPLQGERLPGEGRGHPGRREEYHQRTFPDVHDRLPTMSTSPFLAPGPSAMRLRRAALLVALAVLTGPSLQAAPPTAE